MNSLLVTGGAGFIGSCFTLGALSKGYRVVVLDALTYAGCLENLAGAQNHDQFKFIKGDIRDRALADQLLREYRIDGVINFAAESHVDRSITGAAPFIETNISGTFALLESSLKYWNTLEASDKKSFRYVQISTDEVFGELGPTGMFSETTPYAPNSPYSASKASADLLVRAWFHTFGLPTLVTHCSNNYGPRQYPEKLIPLMILNALEGKDLPVYGKGENIRDWIHVEDHCEGILLTLTKGRPGEHYCFGGRAEKTNISVVKTLCASLDEARPKKDRTKYESQIRFVTDRLGHDWRYAIDDSKAEKELGFKRKYGFENGLKQTLAWYLENKKWIESIRAKGNSK